MCEKSLQKRLASNGLISRSLSWVMSESSALGTRMKVLGSLDHQAGS